MRLFTTFFLFLLLHLAGDGNSVFASNHYGKTIYLSNSYPQAKLVKYDEESQRSLLQQPAELPAKNDFLLFEEEDNEEENSRKAKSPVEPVSIFFSALHISHPGTTLINAFSFCRHKRYPGDCKYITHRVLRI